MPGRACFILFELDFYKWVIPALIRQTREPKKIDFAYFWCPGTSSGDMQISRIFLLYDAYFGFYGGLKFCPPGVPPSLWKAITQPVFELERQSWCQSSSFDPKNLMQPEKWQKIFFVGVITPRGGYFGYPGVPST